MLQKLGWDEDELSPDERAAIRKLYYLEDPGDQPAGIPLTDTGARTLKGDRHFKMTMPGECTQ